MAGWLRRGGVVLGVAAGVALAGLAAAWSGLYNVAADEPHWGSTAAVMEWVRNRSIQARSTSLVVPDLADPALIRDGAGHYLAMCEGCHLAPGIEDSELRAGLYPRPPALTDSSRHRSPAADFWVVKHGLKMTGMPAWGGTHDDTSMWGLVAFVRQLPDMTPEGYRELTGGGSCGAGHDGHGDHPHHTAAAAEPPGHDLAGHQGCVGDAHRRFGDTPAAQAEAPAGQAHDSPGHSHDHR